MQLNSAVGYRGIFRINGSIMLCTGGNVSLTQDPIMSGGVWGAGYYNAAPIAWAWNYLDLTGSANFELTDRVVAMYKLAQFSIYGRANQSGTPITMLPDGSNGFYGQAWCSSLSFEASEGSAVTGSLNFKGDPAPPANSQYPGLTANVVQQTGNWSTHGASGTSATMKTIFAGDTLIAYWQTGYASAKENSTSSLISWSCSYNSDLQLLKCCGVNTSAPKAADYILLGEMTSEASATIFDTLSSMGYMHSTSSALFRIKNWKVGLPKAICNSRSTSMATGASYITAEESYTGVGDSTRPPFVITDLSGNPLQNPGDTPELISVTPTTGA